VGHYFHGGTYNGHDFGLGAVVTDFMQAAIGQAQKAGRVGEVPIGAVIVRDGKVIAKAHNLRERKKNALYHAEILAINKACKKLRSWRLCDCVMYVTLEPCAMCLGAITNARLKKVYFGARSTSDLNWESEVVFDERAECGDILKNFFGGKR
jgi:tRNA(adenine34) deaminase